MVMNKKIILLFSMLLTVSSFAVKAAGNYWVLGSFEAVNNAMTEAEKMRNKTGLDIQVAKYNVAGTTYNRLVVAKDGSGSQRQALAMLEEKPWTLSDGGVTVARTKARARPVQRPKLEVEIIPDPAPRKEPQIVYESVDVTPPGANESYVEYCVRKANPRERELFCSDGMLKRVVSDSVN